MAIVCPETAAADAPLDGPWCSRYAAISRSSVLMRLRDRTEPRSPHPQALHEKRSKNYGASTVNTLIEAPF